MSLYVFVGASATIWHDDPSHTPSMEFVSFGQKAEMNDEFAQGKIYHEGLQLLPKAEFDALGFTADELKQYPTREKQMNAPDDVKAKFAAANTLFKSYRQSLGEVINAGNSK